MTSGQADTQARDSGVTAADADAGGAVTGRDAESGAAVGAAQGANAAAARQNVLRRKLASRAGPASQKAAAPPRAHPLERALARASAAACGLPARAQAKPVRRAALAELLDQVDAGGFVATLATGSSDRPGMAGGATGDEALAGVICLDQGLFAALIEQLATGRLASAVPQPRPATATDAALLAEVIDTLLAFLAEERARQPAAPDTAPGLAGNRPHGTDRLAGDGSGGDPMADVPLDWRFDRFVTNARLLEVLLNDGDYAVSHLAVQLGASTTGRTGTVLLALPVLPAAAPAGAQGAGGGTGSGAAADWKDRFVSTVMQAPADLRGVLARVTLPLGEALALAPGSSLTLPLSALEEVRVEARDTRLLGLARLGQYRGMRALRVISLAEAIEPQADYLPAAGGAHALQATEAAPALPAMKRT
ncbi:MAG: FliM/FliN family flagellar motor switch protein [Pararhodobacter sp.]